MCKEKPGRPVKFEPPLNETPLGPLRHHQTPRGLVGGVEVRGGGRVEVAVLALVEEGLHARQEGRVRRGLAARAQSRLV